MRGFGAQIVQRRADTGRRWNECESDRPLYAETDTHSVGDGTSVSRIARSTRRPTHSWSGAGLVGELFRRLAETLRQGFQHPQQDRRIVAGDGEEALS